MEYTHDVPEENGYESLLRSQFPPQFGIVLAFENPPNSYGIRLVSRISSM